MYDTDIGTNRSSPKPEFVIHSPAFREDIGHDCYVIASARIEVVIGSSDLDWMLHTPSVHTLHSTLFSTLQRSTTGGFEFHPPNTQ
jgi:hypothetical protein